MVRPCTHARLQDPLQSPLVYSIVNIPMLHVIAYSMHIHTLFRAAGACVAYCWWGCCVFTVLTVVVLSGIPMFIGSALLWSKITPEYFEIAGSYDEVICIGCVVVFTVAI